MKICILGILIILNTTLMVNAQNAEWIFSPTSICTGVNIGIGTNYYGTGLVSPIEKLTIGELGGNFAVQDRRTAVSGKFTSGYKFYDYHGEAASVLLEHNGYLSSNVRAMIFSISGEENMRINSQGNIGIGTSSPHVWFSGKVLEISDNRPILSLESSGTLGTVVFTNNQINTTHYGEFHLNHVYDPNLSVLKFSSYPSGDILILRSDGNVGIGTALTNNPNDYKLAVNGTIGAKEVKIEINSSAWSDFVFNDSYKLRPIKEIENYINEKNHLPDIPTAKELEDNGLNLGEMDAKLLQKIEELTLYMIQMNKEIESLKEENKLLKKQVFLNN